MVISPEVHLLLHIVFATLRCLLFQMDLQIALSNCEELNWNFDGNCTEFVDCFGQDGHFYYINPANP